MAQYSIDIAERQAALAINMMYRHLAEEIANTRDVDTAIEHFGVSEKRRLYLSFMQAYAAGIVAANKDIRRNAPRRVAADWGAQETFPLEDDPFIAQYATEAIYGLKNIPKNDRSEIRWRLTHAISSGASIPSITDDLLKYFDGDRIHANQFARTATSDILNRAKLHRYEDSGVVDGIKFMAHIDACTSETCRVMNGTIWALKDPAIQTPPLHFNCVVGDTLIATLQGDRRIKDLVVGDFVLTHLDRFMRVTSTMFQLPDNTLEIQTQNNTLRITADHPVLTQCGDAYRWILAGDLTSSDHVMKRGRHTEKVVSVRRIPVEPVYNISVAEDESYIANDIVVHNCRSDIVAYFGKIPGARDYSKDFDQDMIDRAFGATDTFRNKYWGSFPKTRASAVLQRHYLNTVDINIIREGLTKLIQSPTVGVWSTDLAKRLKAILRYRAVERDSSIVVDAFGKSLLLDVTEREAIRTGLEQLIRLQRLRIDREVAELVIWSDLARPGRERLIAEMRLTLGLYERCLAELPF